MTMLLSRYLFIIQYVFIQFGSLVVAEDERNVNMVMSIDQYYDTVNSNDSYTMVEYTTSWCHHCKKLKPSFLELANLYINDTDKPTVNFLDVNCEIFGSTICRDMPGFPMIYLIRPRQKPLKIPQVDDSEPIWRKIWTKIWNRIEDPMWQLDQDRIINYNGKRETVAMREFIEGVRTKDRLTEKAKNALQEDYICGNDEVCLQGKIYVEKTLEKLSQHQLKSERSKLELILKNNQEQESNIEAIQLVKLKLTILNNFDKYENTDSTMNDEL